MKKKPIVALQLWSVHQVIAADVRGTLKKIAAMGYQGIECAGNYNLSGKEFKGMLDECGLVCTGAHVGLGLLEGEKFEATVAIYRELGTDRLIVPSADLSDMPKLLDRLNAAYARAKTVGMRTGFHNHAREFEVVDGQTHFDRIFAGMPADFMVQLDIGWAASAGQDVSALVRKYAGRIESVHVKEFSRSQPEAAVGNGDIRWQPLFEQMEKETRVDAYIIEQEQYAVGPMESVKECLDNMRKMGRG
jgi:sugar phosphate isomerase/epimerase